MQLPSSSSPCIKVNESMYIEKKMFVKGDRITHFINIRQLSSVMNHSMTGMNSEEYKRKKNHAKHLCSRGGGLLYQIKV